MLLRVWLCVLMYLCVWPQIMVFKFCLVVSSFRKMVCTCMNIWLWSLFGRAGLQLYSNGSLHYTGGVVCAVNGRGRGYVSSWDEKPYEYLPTGRKAYLDEQDIVTFLDPPRELIPLDPASYNPAAYLWSVFNHYHFFLNFNSFVLFCDWLYFEVILLCCENAGKKNKTLIHNLLLFLKLYACVC